MHRDVKSENMLLSKELTVKIADFGVSRIEQGNGKSMRALAGTQDRGWGVGGGGWGARGRMGWGGGVRGWGVGGRGCRIGMGGRGWGGLGV